MEFPPPIPSLFFQFNHKGISCSFGKSPNALTQMADPITLKMEVDTQFQE
jgi:hypothetical protein